MPSTEVIEQRLADMRELRTTLQQLLHQAPEVLGGMRSLTWRARRMAFVSLVGCVAGLSGMSGAWTDYIVMPIALLNGALFLHWLVPAERRLADIERKVYRARRNLQIIGDQIAVHEAVLAKLRGDEA